MLIKIFIICIYKLYVWNLLVFNTKNNIFDFRVSLKLNVFFYISTTLQSMWSGLIYRFKTTGYPWEAPKRVHYWWYKRNHRPWVRPLTWKNEHLQANMNRLKDKLCLNGPHYSFKNKIRLLLSSSFFLFLLSLSLCFVYL